MVNKRQIRCERKSDGVEKRTETCHTYLASLLKKGVRKPSDGRTRGLR
jgi:hypothetical protein